MREVEQAFRAARAASYAYATDTIPEGPIAEAWERQLAVHDEAVQFAEKLAARLTCWAESRKLKTELWRATGDMRANSPRPTNKGCEV
jgi:hypothetical protein